MSKTTSIAGPVKLELSRKTIDAIEIKLVKVKGLIISVNTSEMIKILKQSETER